MVAIFLKICSHTKVTQHMDVMLLRIKLKAINFRSDAELFSRLDLWLQVMFMLDYLIF